MSAAYDLVLSWLPEVILRVDHTTERGEVVDYTLILLLATAEGTQTIRVYDSAHGYNEMHRYGRGAGKRTGVQFHSGSLGEGMRSAIDDVKRGFDEMIEGWRE
ncbi:MAG TPA: hypothetical protein VFR04_01375 [Solirubrobacterales bacterium]|nr:hypothetical protein [Solirubrobacterales bacterium]